MAYVNLDTIQVPTAGSNYPTAAWGKQVNDNFAALKATLDARAETFQAWGLYTTGSVLAEGDITAYDDLHVDGFMRAGAGNPLFAMQRLEGTMDAAGNGTAVHNILSANERVVIVGAFYRGAGDEAIAVDRWTVDGTNLTLYHGAGAENAAWRAVIVYTQDVRAW